VVVDDGSTDNVVELIQQYAAQADFPVRVERIEHGGKHAAWNHGIRLCRGELVFPVDSDDSFPANALERFGHWWHWIPEAERPGYSGINALCSDPATGQIEGDPFPSSPLTTNNLEIEFVMKLTGGKNGCVRADLLRQYPLPSGKSFTGNYVSENLIWFALARKYKVLCINEPLYCYHHDDTNSMSNSNAATGLRGRLRRPVGALYYYKNWNLNTNLDYLRRDQRVLWKTGIDIWFCGFATGRSIGTILRDSAPGWPRLIRLAALPMGTLAYLYAKAYQLRQGGKGSPVASAQDRNEAGAPAS
jgi:glycosyltransferase involved in cell wall biosynthesis